MAATRMKSAGNVELFIARLMVTLPSSSGWREVERGRSKGDIAECHKLKRKPKALLHLRFVLARQNI